MSTKHVDIQLLEITEGMHYLHAQGVIHGDLRGVGNPWIMLASLIFFCFQDNALLEDDHVRLVDFGLCIYANGGKGNYMSTRSGNVRWTAPELLVPENDNPESEEDSFSSPEDDRVYTHRPTKEGDVYSFACVCVEVSTFDPTSMRTDWILGLSC